MDLQEMILWTCLSWRLLSLEQIRELYLQKTRFMEVSFSRPFEECAARLVTRGLAASGTGRTGYEALYDLLANLFVVPVSGSFPLRVLAFLKLTLRDRVPFGKARRLFQADRPNAEERRLLALSRQALLSTAELIKCAEAGVSDLSTDQKVMAALYNDDFTTCDNIRWEMMQAGSREDVTLAVANLYLRKQIIFERLG